MTSRSVQLTEWGDGVSKRVYLIGKHLDYVRYRSDQNPYIASCLPEIGS